MAKRIKDGQTTFHKTLHRKKKLYIEEQTIQWPKEYKTDKQPSTKHYTENKKLYIEEQTIQWPKE